MMKKKILILGISSFAGYTFAKYLIKKNFNIVGTFNSNQKIFSDIRNFKNLKLYKINLEKNFNGLFIIAKKENPNYIIDFSSICMVNESWINPEKYFKINCLSKIKLINNIEKIRNVKKFVYISTPEVFGESKKNLSEDHALFNPSTPYASTKLFTENLIRNYQFSKSKRFIIARFSNFYGPNQPLHRLIPKLIISIKKNKKFIIDGKGLSKRNFIYSDDFCSGINLILNRGATGKTYHFSSKNLYTVRKIVEKVCGSMNIDYKKFVKFGKDRIGKDSVYKLDCRQTKKELNWETKISIDKGIKKIIKHIEENYSYFIKEKTYFRFK